MYQACNQSLIYPVGSSIRVPVGAFPFDETDDRRVLPRRNPRRDYTRRQCKSGPAFQEPTWGTHYARTVGSESTSSRHKSPNGGARRLTPEFKLLSQTRSAQAPRPVNPSQRPTTSRAPPGARGPKPAQKEKNEWVPPPPVTLLPSFNTKPTPAARKSRMSRFFRTLCCC